MALTKVQPEIVSGGPAFYAYLSTAQNVSANTSTKCTLDTEIFDTNNCFSSSRFTPNVAGYYQINCTMRFTTSAGYIQNCFISVNKSGSDYNRIVQFNVGSNTLFSGDQTLAGSTVVYCNGTTDYIEMWGYISNSSGTPAFQAAASYATCNMSGSLVRAA